MGCGGCRQGVTIKIHTANELKAPVLLRDGSIQFPDKETVPDLKGYTPSEKNDHILTPDVDCFCVWKMTGIMLQRDGGYAPNHVCMNQECEHKSKKVDFDICSACPSRQLTR